MISDEWFDPVCWVIEQFDYSSKETLRRIVWEKPEFLIGAEVKPVHIISERKKVIKNNG